ncbi:MAG: O-antigen ligase family protein [Anaerolineae bacterium]
MSPHVEPGLGVNADLLSLQPSELARALDWSKGAGFTWVRQEFLWADIERVQGNCDWSAADRVVAAIAARNLRLIAVLGSTPVWARPAGQEQALWAPPDDYAAFGDFAAAFARRYGTDVDFYEIWDQPNIYPYWGDQYVDAIAYTRLLREAATRIRASDGQAWILLAGLAPNVEDGPLNLNEMAYLRQVCRAGGSAFFDIVAAKPYGFDRGVADEVVAPNVLNFARLSMLRSVLEEEGLPNRPVWAVEFGWNALPLDWQGQPPPWHSGPVPMQAARTAAAIQWARGQWPWMGPMLWARLLPPATQDDPAYGFALLDRQLEPTELGAALASQLSTQDAESLGFHQPNSPTARYSGSWRVTEDGADPGGAGDSVEISFIGTALDLLVRPGPYWAVWCVTVDGLPSRSLPNEQGRSYLVLYDPLGQARQVTVASGLRFGKHVVRLEVQGGWEQWPLAGWVAWREPVSNAAWPVALLAFGVTSFLVSAFIGSWPVLLARLLSQSDKLVSKLPRWLGGVLTFAIGLAFWWRGGLLDSVVLGLALGLCLLLWPSWGVALAAASLPGFLLPKRILAFAPSMVELTVWTLALTQVARWLLVSRLRVLRLRLSGLDMAVLALVALAGLSLLAAENYGVAAMEFRRVILSAAMFYFTIRLAGNANMTRPAATGLIIGAVAVSLWGIWQFVTGSGLIQADGVGRVRAAYGSPNNLALYLERIIPLVASLVVLGQPGKRRLIYLSSLVVMIACGVLTRSRGLLLLGLPVSFVYLLWVSSRSNRRWVVFAGVGAIIIIALVLVSGRLEGLLAGQDEAAAMRLPLWRSAIAMIRERPLLGVGLDNFLYQYRTRYILPSAWHEPNLSHPHNLLLDFWTRLGIGGPILLLWLLVGGWLASGTAMRSNVGDDRATYVGIRAAGLAAVMHGLVDNIFFLVDLSHVFLCLLALAVNGSNGPMLHEDIPCHRGRAGPDPSVATGGVL